MREILECTCLSSVFQSNVEFNETRTLRCISYVIEKLDNETVFYVYLGDLLKIFIVDEIFVRSYRLNRISLLGRDREAFIGIK